MADKFRVGQRVRINQNAEINIGLCGVIASSGYFLVGKRYGYKVNWDDGDFCPAAECYLDPVYDGDEQSSWSECLWKPNPIVHSIED